MKILIVDDMEEGRYLLEALLTGNGYEVVSTINGAEALEKLRAESFDMIVSDVLMPVMDGFQLCYEVKSDEALKCIPFVFYTATYTEDRDEELGMKLGADKFVSKPAEPDVFIKIIQSLERDALEGRLEPKKPLVEEDEGVFKLYSERLVAKLEKKTTDLEAEIAERKKAQENLERALEATVHALGQMAETRDPYTAGHQRRVSQLAYAIAVEMELPEEQAEGIRVVGLMHDIGKMSVPAEILTKPTKLTETEFALIKDHPQVANNLLKTIDFPWRVADIVLQHHERIDGSGYPNALKGDAILLEARILGVADVVEAMASHRPYRPALGIDEALEEISKNKDVQYDSEVVDACVELFQQKEFTFSE